MDQSYTYETRNQPCTKNFHPCSLVTRPIPYIPRKVFVSRQPYSFTFHWISFWRMKTEPGTITAAQERNRMGRTVAEVLSRISRTANTCRELFASAHDRLNPEPSPSTTPNVSPFIALQTTRTIAISRIRIGLEVCESSSVCDQLDTRWCWILGWITRVAIRNKLLFTEILGNLSLWLNFQELSFSRENTDSSFCQFLCKVFIRMRRNSG